MVGSCLCASRRLLKLLKNFQNLDKMPTTFFREFAGQDSRLGRPPRPSQAGSLQGPAQKGVFLAAETRNVQASPPAVKSKFLLVIRRVAHSLKGSVGIFSSADNGDAFAAAQRMESIGSEGNFAAAAAAYASLDAAVTRLRPNVLRFAANDSPPVPERESSVR